LCDSISDTNFSIAGFDTLLLFFILAPCKLFMLFLFLTIFTTYTNFLTPSLRPLNPFGMKLLKDFLLSEI
ncbi:hypothetical protein, partial [Rickettsia sp. R1]